MLDPFPKYQPVLRSLGLYLLLLAGCWISAALLILYLGYENSFLFLNRHFISWLDWPMLLLTHVGDAMVLVPVVAILLWRHKPETVLILIIAVLLSGLMTQLLKHFLFENWNRPPGIFVQPNEIHTVAGYKLYYNSFPSGHSTTVFSVFTVLAFAYRESKLKMVLLLLCSLLLAYTRVYTGVHFPADVLAGSVIGTVVTLLCIKYLWRKTETLLQHTAYSKKKIAGYVIYSLGIAMIVLFIIQQMQS